MLSSGDVVDPPAPVGVTASDARDCVLLIVETRSRHQAVRVRRDDYEPFAGWGQAAIRRAIAAALHRSSGVFSNGLLAIEFVQGGRVVPTTALPADWEALGRFRESGGTCRLRTRLPGGIRPATLHSKVRLSEEMVGMSPELDSGSRWVLAEALPWGQADTLAAALGAGSA